MHDNSIFMSSFPDKSPTLADTRSFWNQISREWVRKNQLDKYTRRLDQVVQMIERHVQPCSCLDIGCGDGALLLELSKRGFDVYGCDVSDELVRVTAQKLEQRLPDASERCRMIQNNKIPFPQSFGLITVMGVLVYIPNHRNYLSHLGDHLSSDGVLVASVTQRRSLHTLHDICRNLRHPSLRLEWRTGILNLIRTGIWSGGFMDNGTSGRVHSVAGIERLLKSIGFDILDRWYVYNMARLDRNPLTRSLHGRFFARLLGWRQSVVAKRRQTSPT